MDHCEQCAHYVTDEEFGDYCDVNLDDSTTNTKSSANRIDRCRGG